ncbi:hypothetical protein WJX74_009556 [Apatococcus lobatus]|uniref:Uncharacterized protein n=1 Tax=Apatococcus lobatus TaxID=904363 RepID=A0AAW1QZ87_9CHLO
MAPAKTQQTDTEELADLKQANTHLKRELLRMRRLSTHHRVQQLIQHVQELEDVIISMKDDLEELQQERHAALSDAAAARRKLRDRQQQASLAMQGRDLTVAAAGEAARQHEEVQSELLQSQAGQAQAQKDLQQAVAANQELQDRVAEQHQVQQDQHIYCGSLQHQVEHWKRTCCELRAEQATSRELLQKLASPACIAGLDSPDHLQQAQTLREQLQMAEEHAASSQHLMSALKDCHCPEQAAHHPLLPQSSHRHRREAECPQRITTRHAPLVLDCLQQQSTEHKLSHDNPPLLEVSLDTARSIEDLVGRLEGFDEQQAEAGTALRQQHEALERQAAISCRALEQQLLRSRALEQMRLSDVQELASMQRQLLECNQTIWRLRSLAVDRCDTCEAHQSPSDGSHADWQP